jgi:hypothetical protein
MKSLSYLVIFVALATLFHQSSGNEKHLRDKILRAHHEAKKRLDPSGKPKSLVGTRQTFDGTVSFLRGRINTFNNTCVKGFSRTRYLPFHLGSTVVLFVCLFNCCLSTKSLMFCSDMPYGKNTVRRLLSRMSQRCFGPQKRLFVC